MTHKTGTDLINEATARVRQVSAAAVKEMMERGDPAVYLDVREPNEYNLGHLPGALHIPRGYLELKVESAVPRDATIVAYCSAGVRSALAVDTLQQLGYVNAVSLAGGWRDWMTSDGPVEG
jgi:rhodanese-related sulfurtransferase